MKTLIFAIRNTGWYAAVPVLVAALGCAGFFAVEQAGPTQLVIYYATFMRTIAPLFAAWWPLFVFKERVEGDGRELLYLLRPRGESATATLLAGAYVAVLTPLGILAATRRLPEAIDTPAAWGACVCSAALAFWVVFATRSSPLALLAAVAFGLFGQAAFARLVAAVVALVGPRPDADVLPWLAWLGLAVAMLLHGERLSRKFAG
ncbi:MAG: hypothetical protein N3B11_07950 [Coriobacteriia bacterium]|nr:hypothetical protein [Coriobacteriia bacterium]